MVSELGLGGNNFGRACDFEKTREVVDAALDSGITFIDTADSYGLGESESLLGSALVGRRKDVVLATKFGFDMQGRNGPGDARGSRHYIIRAVEASLRRLRTDYIDLYQYHFPDGITPIAETLAALDTLVTSGKVRYVGSSNVAGWQVADADWTARSLGLNRFVSTQSQYSLLHRSAELELSDACRHLDVSLIPWYPLARGLLTGKYLDGAPPGSRLEHAMGDVDATVSSKVAQLNDIAIASGRSLLDLALGGLLAQPAVTSVIVGCTSPEQVRSNVRAAEAELDEAELAAIDRVVPPGSSWV
jgi:aryl-alcohol dehydrogenase-like predicted oxidoreductase